MAAGCRCIYVMRHGPKEANLSGKDNFALPLTADAAEALTALRGFLHEHGVHFGVALCSPFVRCRQTLAQLEDLVVAKVEGGSNLEPGLAEVLDDSHGLRTDPIPAGVDSLGFLQERLQQTLGESGGSAGKAPLVAVSELEYDEDESFMQTMLRTARLVQRLSPLHYAQGPLLLVTHGGTAFGIIQALLRGTGKVEPYDKDQCLDMGGMVQLEEATPGAGWRIVRSVVPTRSSDGEWGCHWTSGRASGGDHAQL